MKFPLRIAIPALLIAFTLLLALWSLHTNGEIAIKNIEQEMLADFKNRLTVLQEDVEHEIRRNNFERLNRKILSLGSDNNIKNVFLADENDRIVVESRFEFIGKNFNDVLPPEKTQKDDIKTLIEVAKSRRFGETTLSHDKNTLWGVYPIRFGREPGGIRPTRVGVLIAQVDLVAPKIIALSLVKNQVIQFCLFLCVLVIGLWLIIYLQVARRIQNLVIATERFSKGDFKAPVKVGKGDEISILEMSFAEMAKKRAQQEKKLEEHQKHLESVVEERTQELTRANERLLELDHLKSLFMASMSHELRTPLNSIIGFNGILLNEMAGKINARQKDYLNRAYKSGKHLLGLITDIMDISKIESGQVKALPELFNLNEVVTEAMDYADAQKMKNKGIEFKVEAPPSLEIYNDRQRVLQCILNLLNNAIKFTQSGSITLSAREADDQVVVVVEDTGIGIAKADLPKLFQQFERLDSHLKIPAGGTGLGLYLTKKLATEVLAGSVEVESQLGVGSKFFLKFPKTLKQQTPGNHEMGSGERNS